MAVEQIRSQLEKYPSQSQQPSEVNPRAPSHFEGDNFHRAAVRGRTLVLAIEKKNGALNPVFLQARAQVEEQGLDSPHDKSIADMHHSHRTA
jgi:hypothetical protein